MQNSIINQADSGQKPLSGKAEMLERLVRTARRGDNNALIQLCEMIAKDIVFQVKFVLRNITEADDVSQEVMIRVCEKIRNLRDPKAFRSWLNRIIVNEINRHWAKDLSRPVLLNIEDLQEELLEENSEFIPQEYVDLEETQRLVMNVTNELSEQQRQFVILHYYEQFGITEIALDPSILLNVSILQSVS